MKLGQLRHQVVIEYKVAASPQQFANGEPDESWQTFATVYAAVMPMNAREFFGAKQVGSEVSVRVRMHYLAGVTAAMRINFGGQYYNIDGIRNIDMLNRELELMCSVGRNQG